MTISVSFFPPGSILKPDYNNSKKRKKKKAILSLFSKQIWNILLVYCKYFPISFSFWKKSNAKNNGTVPPPVWFSCHYFPKKELLDLLDLVFDVSLIGELQ